MDVALEQGGVLAQLLRHDPLDLLDLVHICLFVNLSVFIQVLFFIDSRDEIALNFHEKTGVSAELESGLGTLLVLVTLCKQIEFELEQGFDDGVVVAV